MAEEAKVAGRVQPSVRGEASRYAERESEARRERHERAAAEAARLFQNATAASSAPRPTWAQALILLMEELHSEYATLTVQQSDAVRRWRLTRGQGLPASTSARQPLPADETAGPDPASARIEIEALCADPAAPLTSGPKVPGARSSFHAPLYASGAAEALGCVSLYSSRDLALGADRVAFLHAVAALLAGAVADSPLPDATMV